MFLLVRTTLTNVDTKQFFSCHSWSCRVNLALLMVIVRRYSWYVKQNDLVKELQGRLFFHSTIIQIQLNDIDKISSII